MEKLDIGQIVSFREDGESGEGSVLRVLPDGNGIVAVHSGFDGWDTLRFDLKQSENKGRGFWAVAPESCKLIVDAPPAVPAALLEAHDEALARKARPLARGLLDYFPDALLEVSHVSLVGNEQHHTGAPLHWEKDKSKDHADCIMRHLIGRGTRDRDKLRHTAKVAWRALALLQAELEAEDDALCALRQEQRDAAARGLR